MTYLFRRFFLLFLTATLITTLVGKPLQNVWAAPNAESNPRPKAAATPLVSLDMPTTAFIGSDFIFNITFDNNGTDTGYGPYVDMFMDTTGPDGIYPGTDPAALADWQYDGLKFLGASYLGAPITTKQLIFGASGIVIHPYAHQSGLAYDSVTKTWKEYKRYLTIGLAGTPGVDIEAPAWVSQGDTLVVLLLPFGSFVPNQPPATIAVKANMSNLSDLGATMPVAVSGGFQFGLTPLDDWCCEPIPSITTGITDTESVGPELVKLSKTHNAAEGETATGPNYPLTYTIGVDLAKGQEFSYLKVEDFLPNSIVYQNAVSSLPSAYSTVTSAPLTDQPYNAPNNLLAVEWVDPADPDPADPSDGITTAVINGDDDAKLSFEFYVPHINADGNPIVGESGNDGSSCNDMAITYTWIPIDARDLPFTQTSNSSICDVSLRDEALVLRKGATNITDSTNSPGDVIRYTLNFQVSDYFALQDLQIEDLMSDGQRYFQDAVKYPTLSVNGNDYTLGTAAIDANNLLVECNYTGGPGSECDTDNPDPNNGKTRLLFNITNEIIDRGETGQLLGACLNPSGGWAATCTSPVTGTITYYAIVQEEFTDTPGDISLDQGDHVNNTATANVTVLDRITLTTIGSAANTSSQTIQIDTGTLIKGIYSINGTQLTTAQQTDPEGLSITPGDVVTYRLTYTLPTSDVENLFFQDYLPLPVFRIEDFDNDGDTSEPWNFDPTISTASPPAGTVKFGPLDTFYNYSNITPSITTDLAANLLTITYGNFDDPANTKTVVDLLFTVTVTDDPFADGLFLTNQARASESNTFTSAKQDDAIVRIVVDEPLIIEMTKAAIASDNPNATPEAPLGANLPPVTFNTGASFHNPGAPFTGTISSDTNDPANSLGVDANLTQVDSGDTVRFAIFIENQGDGLRGAFDLAIKDTLPTGLKIPAGGLNIKIYNGAGEALYGFTGLGGGPDATPNTEDDLFGSGIQINDPPIGDPNYGEGACQSHTLAAGRNIIIITYDLQLENNLESGQVLVNNGELTRYASQEGGRNFLTDPLKDSAAVTIADPSLEKTLVSTGIENAHNLKTDAVIGEFVTYDLRITVPEGLTNQITLTDEIPTGLQFESYQLITEAASSSTQLTKDFAGTVPALTDNAASLLTPGGSLALEFTAPVTATADNDQTNNTFLVRVRLFVPNVAANQSGTTLTNNATLAWVDEEGATQTTTATNNQLTLIEPVLTVQKTSTPAAPAKVDAGDPLSYTITVTNTGNTHAFDISLYDLLPRENPLASSESWLLGPSILSATQNAIDVSAQFEIIGADATGWELQTVASSNIDLAPADVLTITVQATVSGNVSPSLILTNTATAKWTSLNNDDLNDGQDTSERTGNAPAPDDYSTDDDVDVQVDVITPAKTIVSTSQPHTSDANLAIGEEVRYRLAFNLPEGVVPTLQVTDAIPAGMLYLGGETILFASNDGGTCNITSDQATLTGSGLCQVGSAASSPSFSLPASLVSNPSNPGNPFAAGDDVAFDLGSLTNGDRDADYEYVVIEFDARVLNVAANQQGSTLANTFSATKNGTNIGTSSAQNINVVEPVLTVTKTRLTSAIDAGDTLNYRLTISASSAANTTTAYDLTITDQLPYATTPYLDLAAPITITCPVTTICADVTTYTGSPDSISVTADKLAPGEQIVIDFSTTILSTFPIGRSLNNTGTVTWTSLPEDGDARERSSTGGVNDYTHTSPSNNHTPSSAPTIDKLALTDSTYTLGQTVTYNILITLPEGVTRDLRIRDALPVGLEFQSYELITTSAAPGSILTNDYAGSAVVSTAPSAGDTGTLTFALSNTATTADNVTTNNSFQLRLSALVQDVPTNFNGAILTNNASLLYKRGTSSTDTTITDATPVTLTIVEPELEVQKGFTNPAPNSIGDYVEYTITITHTAASTDEAQGLQFTDTLPVDLLLDISSIVCSAACTDSSALNTVNLAFTDPLPLGETRTITFRAQLLNTITPGVNVDNTGTITWTNGEGISRPTYTDDDLATFSILEAAFVKTIQATSAGHTAGSNLVIGETVTYKLTIELPEGTIPTLTVTDRLPDGLVYISSVVDGATNANADVLPTPTLSGGTSSGEDITFTFTGPFIVDDAGPATTDTFDILITARVVNEIGNQAGTILRNDGTVQVGGGSVITSSAVDVNVVEPVVTIKKSVTDADGDGLYEPDELLTFTLYVENTSAIDAYDLVVLDTLDALLNYETGSALPLGWAPVYDLPTHTLTYTGDLLAGTNVSLTYVVKVDSVGAAPADVLSNDVETTYTSLPGLNANERTGSGGVNDYTTSDTFNLTYSAVDLELSKDDGGISSAPGNTITYTLYVENLGNAAATGITLYETIPTYTTFNAGASAVGWVCAGSSCEISLGSLLPGASTSVAFAVMVENPLRAGVTEVTNTASVDATETEHSTTNNSDQDTTPVVAAPSVTVSKSDGLSIVAPGHTLNYTITVTNTGDQHLSNVLLGDTLPAGVTFFSASNGGLESAGLVTWPLFDLAAGANTTRTVSVQVQDDAALASASITSLTNTVNVEDDASNTSGLKLTSSATDVDTIAISQVKQLVSTSETDSTLNPATALERVFVGETLTYRIQITLPPGTATNLVATDTLENGLAFDACTALTIPAGVVVTLPTGVTDACPADSGDARVTNDGHNVQFTFGTVENTTSSNQTLIIDYTAVVLDIASNVDGVNDLNNRVTWAWNGGSLSGEAAAVEIIEPDLSIAKTANTNYAQAGDIITFTVDIAHTTQSTADAYDVIVTDILPDGLDFVTGSVVVTGLPYTSLTYDAPTATLSFVWDTFPLGATSSLTFQTRLVSTPVVNSANVAWTSLPIDPGFGGLPVQFSDYNPRSTERWYDPAANVNIDNYSASASVEVLSVQTLRLPATGFAPNRVTTLPIQPDDLAYTALSNVELTIPSLGLNLPVMSIPVNANGWNLTWLSNQAGYLTGTTLPGDVGNTALTAHVYLADGTPGPFVNLKNMAWGQVVTLSVDGYKYTYEVRENRLLRPSDSSILREDGYTWLTLITCQTYNEASDTYLHRRVVRAVLISVEKE